MAKTFAEVYELAKLSTDDELVEIDCSDATLQEWLTEYKHNITVENLPPPIKEYIIFTAKHESSFNCLRQGDGSDWKYVIEIHTKQTIPYDLFIFRSYLSSYVYFAILNGNPNPPVFYWYECDPEFSVAANTVADYTYQEAAERHRKFLERLAGRVELQARVETAKVIFRPLREKAIKLLTSAPGLEQERQVESALHWLQWTHKELFYNVYSPRYHANFDLWHKEMTKYNNLILKYLAKARPHIAAINPLYSQIVDELEIGFTNFAMRINEVAAAPDATVRQPSQAAKNAANEQRDITDFLI